MGTDIQRALIIAAAIIAGFVLHALMMKDVGRFQLSADGGRRIDTTTGEMYEINGNPWPGDNKLPKTR